MDIERYQRYCRRLSDVEEPIRDILSALWKVPFILDTGECCSGHVIADNAMVRKMVLHQILLKENGILMNQALKLFILFLLLIHGQTHITCFEELQNQQSGVDTLIITFVIF